MVRASDTFKKLACTKADISLYLLFLEEERSFQDTLFLRFVDSYRENKFKLKLNRVLYIFKRRDKLFTT